MRVRPFLLAAALLLTPLSMGLFDPHAQAQAVATPGCDGSYNIVRVSDIKPGMMAKFVQAVAAQKAWYKAAGATDEIMLMRVVDREKGAFSDTQALTAHTSPGNAVRLPHDAGYDAFVAMFKESSTIKQEYVTCIAKP